MVDITIKGSQQDLLLTIYNILGEVMGTATINGYVELNVSDFPNGLYQIKMVNLQGKEYFTRLIVTK